MKVGEIAGGGQGQVVPAGMYSVEVTFSVLQDQVVKAKANGDVQFSMPMKILTGEYAGQIVWSNFTLTPKAIWVLGQFLQQLGYDDDTEMGDPYNQDEEFMTFIGGLDGCQFQIECTCEEVFSSKQQKNIDVNKVTAYYPKSDETQEAAAAIFKAKPVPAVSSKAAVKPPIVKPGAPGKPGTGAKPHVAKPPVTKAATKPPVGKPGPSKNADLPDWAKGPVGGDPIDGEGRDAGQDLEENPL